MVVVLPLKVTLVADARFRPSIVTGVLVVPIVGLKSVTMGPMPVKNSLVLVTEPSAVVTLISPLVAPEGTVAFNCEVETIEATAVAPLNLTVTGVKKFPPLMTTAAPMAAAAGENPVMVGALEVIKLLVLTLVPALVMTVIGPLAAPAGTVTTTSVKATTLPLTEAFVPEKTTMVPLVTKLAPWMET